jgi:outer membrane lipoprotein SlyB
MKTTTLAILAVASAMMTSCAPASIVSGASYWSCQAQEADRLSLAGEQALAIRVKQMIDSDVRE